MKLMTKIYTSSPTGYVSIGAFVICLFERIISKLATSKFSIFYLVSVAEKTGLCPSLLETPKTGFVALMPILSSP